MTTLEKLSDNIRLVLLASPKSVNSRGLDHLYHLSYDEHINYRRFGFKTLDQLIKAIPNFVKINNRGELVPILSEKFQELENLIQAPNATVRRNQQRSRAVFVNDDVVPVVSKPNKVRNDLDFLKQLESKVISYNAAEDGDISRQNELPKPTPSSVPFKAPILSTLPMDTNVKAPKEVPKPLMDIKLKPNVPPLLPASRYNNGSSFNQKGQSRVLKTNSSYNKYTKSPPKVLNGYHNDDSKPKVMKDNKNNRSDVWSEVSESDDLRNHIDNKKNSKPSSESYHQPRHSAKENINVQQSLDSKRNSDISNKLLHNDLDKPAEPQSYVKKEERVPIKREQNVHTVSNGFGHMKSYKSGGKGSKHAASDYLNLRGSQSVGQKSRSFVPEGLRNKLLNLCKSNPKGIWLSNLSNAFESKYSEKLKKYFGSSTVLNFCTENDDIFQLVRPGHGDWLVFHVGQIIPDILNDHEDDFVSDRKANVRSPIAALPEVTDSEVVVIQDNGYYPESAKLGITTNQREIIDFDDVDSIEDYPPNVMRNDRELLKQWIPSNLSSGTILRVNVLEIFNPRKFWMNISRAEYFKETINEVQTYYEVQHLCYKMKKCHLKMNQYCVISFQENNKMRYRRARIINCFLSSKVVEVFLVDFGFIIDCRIENVYYLKTQFCERPQQAVRAKLHNIEPVDSFWNIKATEKFSELTKKSYLLATVKEIHTEDKILEVMLIDDHNENEDEVNIGDKLVRLNLAKYTNNQDSDSKEECLTFDDIELSLFPYRQIFTNQNEPLNHLYLPLVFKDRVMEKNRPEFQSNRLPQLKQDSKSVAVAVSEDRKIGLVNGYRKDGVNSSTVVINRTRVHNLFRKGSSSTTDNDGDDDESDDVSDSQRCIRIRRFNISRRDNDSMGDTESDSDNYSPPFLPQINH